MTHIVFEPKRAEAIQDNEENNPENEEIESKQVDEKDITQE
jgi:hypothetical protein